MVRLLCYRFPMGPGLRLSAICGLVLLTACEARIGDETKMADAPAVLPTLQVTDAPLTRADLLLAVMRAGSAAAVGGNDAAAQRGLADKRFELRLRFGCADAAIAAAPGAAAFDPQARTVKLSFPAELNLANPAFGTLLGQDVEAIEGFWIRRPWLLEPACPLAVAERMPTATLSNGLPSVPSPPAEPLELPRIGIAQIFTQSDARTHRREQRAYQATESLVVDEAPSRAGYDMVIEGRLRAFPTGHVIACAPAADRPPTCMISARFDSVSIERADTGELVADWPSG